MKYTYFAAVLAVTVMLVVPILPRTQAVGSSSPVLVLPADPVYLRVEDGDKAVSRFNLVLSYVPSGYDITDGTYRGWCIQPEAHMTKDTDIQLHVYSLFDDSLPAVYKSINWTCINYILNNKDGKNATSIQAAIWWYSNHTKTSDAGANELIKDATLHASGFSPGPGNICAIPVEGFPSTYKYPLQRTFLEITLPTVAPISGRVWNDIKQNNLREYGEPGLGGVTITLCYTNHTVKATTTTTDNGLYGFTDVPSGTYLLKITPLDGYTLCPTVPGSATINSDFSPTTKETSQFTFDPLVDQVFDCGMYTTNHGSIPTRNLPPSANALAGAPYQGITGKPVLFQGWYSSDSDGSIVQYLWDFGDGMQGTGENASHVYLTPGVYKVSLTVVDDRNASDTCSVGANITQYDRAPSPPTVIGVYHGTQLKAYNFTITAYDEDGGNLTYRIDWGDGTNATASGIANTSAQTTHAWTAYGMYWITALAVDLLGSSSSPSQIPVYIGVWNVGTYGFLIDTNGTGNYTAFHCNATGNLTITQQVNPGQYLIDTNGDHTYDILYTLSTGTITPFTTKAAAMNLVSIGLIAGTLLVVMFIGLVLAYVVSRRKKKSS